MRTAASALHNVFAREHRMTYSIAYGAGGEEAQAIVSYKTGQNTGGVDVRHVDGWH
jgi:hypothetical protein